MLLTRFTLIERKALTAETYAMSTISEIFLIIRHTKFFRLFSLFNMNIGAKKVFYNVPVYVGPTVFYIMFNQWQSRRSVSTHCDAIVTATTLLSLPT